MKKPMKTYAVRLPRELEELLLAKAEEFGVSPGACIRVLLSEALLGQSYVMEEFRKIEERDDRQEELLKSAVVALLVDAGKASPEEAHTFVREDLARRSE